MSDWKGLLKSVEEVAELIAEMGSFIQHLMKLHSYPSGQHPRRRKNLVKSVEEEAADALATIDYLIDKNGLDRSRIERRRAYKYRKFEKRWGDVPAAIKAGKHKNTKKQGKKRASK